MNQPYSYIYLWRWGVELESWINPSTSERVPPAMKTSQTYGDAVERRVPDSSRWSVPFLRQKTWHSCKPPVLEERGHKVQSIFVGHSCPGRDPKQGVDARDPAEAVEHGTNHARCILELLLERVCSNLLCRESGNGLVAFRPRGGNGLDALCLKGSNAIALCLGSSGLDALRFGGGSAALRFGSGSGLHGLRGGGNACILRLSSGDALRELRVVDELEVLGWHVGVVGEPSHRLRVLRELFEDDEVDLLRKARAKDDLGSFLQRTVQLASDLTAPRERADEVADRSFVVSSHRSQTRREGR